MRGLSPLGAARQLRVLAQRLERSFADEANAAVGYVLPVPTDGQSGNIEDLKDSLAKLAGRIAVVETTRGGWGEGGSAAPGRDFALERLGADFPAGNVQLFTSVMEAVLAACGYPVQLVQAADGTSQREAWRRYLHGTVAPLARLVETDAERIGLPIVVNFDALFRIRHSGARAPSSPLSAAECPLSKPPARPACCNRRTDMRKFIIAAAILAMSGVSASAGAELDQSKSLLLRPGIDELGVTVERFVHLVRTFPHPSGGTMLVDIEGRSITARHSSTPKKGLRFELNPLGDAAYMVAQVCTLDQSRCFTRFKHKRQLTLLFLGGPER